MSIPRYEQVDNHFGLPARDSSERSNTARARRRDIRNTAAAFVAGTALSVGLINAVESGVPSRPAPAPTQSGGERSGTPTQTTHEANNPTYNDMSHNGEPLVDRPAVPQSEADKAAAQNLGQ